MSDYQQQSFGEQPIHDPQRAFPPPQPSSAGSPRRRGRAVLLGLSAVCLVAAGFGAGLLVGTDGGGDAAQQAGIATTSEVPDNGPTPDPIVTPTDEYTPTETVPAYATPTAKDFKLTVKVLKKECFGSAGCNLTYRVLVAYSGSTLDPAVTYEVGYQVRGGEDGPVINTLTVTGDTSSVDEEESVSTKNNSTKLTVSATDVSGR